MSRKDFELIARALKDTRPLAPTSYTVNQGENLNQWCITVLNFADALKTTNPQFNHERFLRACGY